MQMTTKLTYLTAQTFESELATKVSVMFQQRSTLQIENHKLKEQMIKLQQEKLLAEGQYQYLRKEAERLKAHLGSHSHMNKINTLKELSSASKLVGSEPSWQISDLWKLDLS
ncbi:hypothetical protein Leryth_014618 [Lithospermum erythrorhizon]|nr:hypothetical protein Leryth_014618 [Lithospermum erythrorhizon]